MWVDTRYPDPAFVAGAGAELHDRRLVRVVQQYQAGEVAPASVVRAVAEWRGHVTATTWVSCCDAELARVIDRVPARERLPGWPTPAWAAAAATLVI